MGVDSAGSGPPQPPEVPSPISCTGCDDEAAVFKSLPAPMLTFSFPIRDAEMSTIPSPFSFDDADFPLSRVIPGQQEKE